MNPTLNRPDQIEPRPSVMAFARMMEATLRKSNYTKGGQEEWREIPISVLKNRLTDEFAELLQELNKPVSGSPGEPIRDGNRIVEEAVDLANFAMMIVDCCKMIASDPPVETGSAGLF